MRGRGDYRWREPKKPKKGAKRPAVPLLTETPPPVEVIRKKRKRRGEETGESS